MSAADVTMNVLLSSRKRIKETLDAWNKSGCYSPEERTACNQMAGLLTHIYDVLLDYETECEVMLHRHSPEVARGDAPCLICFLWKEHRESDETIPHPTYEGDDKL